MVAAVMMQNTHQAGSIHGDDDGLLLLACEELRTRGEVQETTTALIN